MSKRLPLALAVVLSLPALPATAENVGNIGAANPAAFGTPPGAGKRTLAVGLGVQKGERIDTSPEGSAQIVFNDTSTLTVGRNSSVVIDDFVYRGGRGSQGVELAKGVMRFVGGSVSHVSGASLKTPTAAISVRGGSVLTRIGGECGALVVHQVGIVAVTGGDGRSQILDRPGFGVCASETGVSEPFRVSGATIAEITAQMSSRGGQSGGARHNHTAESASMLGDHAPASIEPPLGLSALSPAWTGNAIVQSGANVTNQPVRPTASPTEALPPEGNLDLPPEGYDWPIRD